MRPQTAPEDPDRPAAKGSHELAEGQPEAVAHGEAAGRIGPNSITRLAEVVREELGRAAEAQLFSDAHLAHYLATPPTEMVDERDVAALYGALADHYPERHARRLAWRAGSRTGTYLLEKRIPKPIQRVLRRLPRRLGGMILKRAIARNAWTFTGSGHLEVARGLSPNFTIEQCKLCDGRTPTGCPCAFYAGTFERLYRELISVHARADLADCRTDINHRCTVSVTW